MMMNWQLTKVVHEERIHELLEANTIHTERRSIKNGLQRLLRLDTAPQDFED